MALQIDSINPSTITEEVGTEVVLSCEASGGQYTSGTVWSLKNDFSPLAVSSVASSGNTAIFFMSSSSNLYKTTDGTNYSELTGKFISTSAIISAGYGNGIWVAFVSGSTTAYISDDEFNTYTTATVPVLNYREVFYENGVFIVRGTGSTFLTSPDGYVWTSRNLGTGNIRSVRWFINAWVFTAQSTSRIRRTTDFVNSSSTAITTTSFVDRIENVNGTLTVFPYETDRTIWTSTDGISWATVALAIPTTIRREHSYFGLDGRVYLTQYTDSTIISSTDCVTWRTETGASSGVNEVIFPLTGKILTSNSSAEVFAKDVAVPYVKTLIDTSDDSAISSASPYTYTADIADNGKDFQWEVTDGVTTVQSALIPVVVNATNLSLIWSPEEITGDELSTHFLTVTASGGESSGFGPNQIVDGSPTAEEVVVQSPWEVDGVRPWGVREVPISEVVDSYYFVPNDYTNTSEEQLSYLKQTIQINQLTTFSVQCTQIVSWGRELDYGRIKCTFLNVTNQVIGDIYLLSNYNPMVDGYTSFFMKGSVGWFTKEHSLNTTTPIGTRYVTLEFQSFSPEVIKRMGFTDIELFPLTLGYTYSLLKNGIEVTDKSYFNYLGDPADTDFQWSVSDGVSTRLSDLIPVNITGTPIPIGMKLILSKDSNPIERIIIPLSNDGGGVITYSREPEVVTIFNQYQLEMMDGIVHTSERAPFKRIKKELLILSIPKSFGEGINNFVTNVLHFSDEPFTIELIDNNCYDVSLGLEFEKEPKVTNCVLIEESVFEMINYKEPGLCDVRLTYEFGG